MVPAPYSQSVESAARSLPFTGLAGGSYDMNFGNLKFGGDEGLLSQDSKDLFSVTLTNTAVAGNTRTARFFAPDSSSTGRVVEGAFNDTSNAAGLVAESNPRAIGWLNEFVRRNPSLINKIYVSTDDNMNLGFTWNIYRWSPFASQLESTPIRPASKTNEYRNQSNEVTIKQEIFVGSQSYIEIPVKAQTSITLHFYFLAISNPELLFARQIDAMKRSLQAQMFSGR